MLELRFNLKLMKLIFSYILMFYWKKIDEKKLSTHPTLFEIFKTSRLLSRTVQLRLLNRYMLPVRSWISCNHLSNKNDRNYSFSLLRVRVESERRPSNVPSSNKPAGAQWRYRQDIESNKWCAARCKKRKKKKTNRKVRRWVNGIEEQTECAVRGRAFCFVPLTGLSLGLLYHERSTRPSRGPRPPNCAPGKYSCRSARRSHAR